MDPHISTCIRMRNRHLQLSGQKLSNIIERIYFKDVPKKFGLCVFIYVTCTADYVLIVTAHMNTLRYAECSCATYNVHGWWKHV